MYTPEIATINSTFNWSMSNALNNSNLNITRVNRFDFSGERGDKYAETIIRTIQYLGWMSLKNDDHAASGANPTQTKKILKDAIATRKAADSLLASGSIVLLGTWSNGIAVGPGVGFSDVTNEPEVIAPVRTMKVRKPRAAAKPGYQKWQEESDHIMAGRTCPWSPDVMHGPAFVAKPRVRVPLATMQACSPRWMPAQTAQVRWWHDGVREERRVKYSVYTYVLYSNGEIRVKQGSMFLSQPAANLLDDARRVLFPVAVEEPVQPATAPPTPIYTPSVGDTVQICYQHERMTTDRIVNVQRVAADGKTFRGYDRTYDRVRNYEMARVLTIRRLSGEGVDIAAG